MLELLPHAVKQNPRASERRGGIGVQSGRHADAAVTAAKKALNRNEKFTPAMLVMAKAYYKLGKFEWVRTLWDMMQQSGADLETVGDYLRELESSGANFESALAVWGGRAERAAWVEQWKSRGRAAQPLVRYRVAEGVELLIEPGAALSVERMQRLLMILRQAFDEED